MAIRNKELLDRKIQKLEGQLQKLLFLTRGQGTAKQFQDEIDLSKETLAQIKSIVEKEGAPRLG
tara:strand:- start:531 stop:722 length:192 start_codon:yes stop_codon:yes gene_type:complete